MPSSAHIRSPARRPEGLHLIIQDAINRAYRADLDALLDVPDDDATVVVPPDGRSAHGRDEIRAAIAPLLALAPEMATAVVKTLGTEGLAMTHGHRRLAVAEDGNRSDLHGLGTMVSRRRPDGTWRIVLDDPPSGP